MPTSVLFVAALLAAPGTDEPDPEAAWAELSPRNGVDLGRDAEGRIVRLWVSRDDALEPVVRRLADLPHLESVRIHVRRVTDDVLVEVAKRRRSMELEIACPGEGASYDIAPLSALRDLHRLVLWSATGVTDDDLAALSGLTRLEELSLHGASITDAGLRHLAELVNLRRLDLSGTAVHGPGLRFLGRLSLLTTLDLSETRIGGGHLAHLAPLTNLKRLVLSDCPALVDTDLSALARVRGLEELRLRWTSLRGGRAGRSSRSGRGPRSCSTRCEEVRPASSACSWARGRTWECGMRAGRVRSPAHSAFTPISGASTSCSRRGRRSMRSWSSAPAPSATLLSSIDSSGGSRSRDPGSFRPFPPGAAGA